MNKEWVESEGLAIFAGALPLGLEGIVRRMPRVYKEGPRVTGHWLKIKNRDYQRKGKVELHPRKITR